jgi:hypothetical protein
LRFTPTCLHASLFSIPWLINRTYKSRFAVNGIGPRFQFVFDIDTPDHCWV